jgi:hypothetical protein
MMEDDRLPSINGMAENLGGMYLNLLLVFRPTLAPCHPGWFIMMTWAKNDAVSFAGSSLASDAT